MQLRKNKALPKQQKLLMQALGDRSEFEERTLNFEEKLDLDRTVEQEFI